MKRFSRALAVALGIAVLGSFVSLVPQKNATGAPGAPVMVVNTPLPVSVANAAMPITGTVNANVTNATLPVSGTVNIGTMPALNVAFPSSLNVGNIATMQTGGVPNILMVRNVDDTALQPFQQQATLTFADGQFVGNVTSSPISVPSGERLILEYVAANGFVPAGNRFTFQLGTFFNNNVTSQETASTGAVTIGGSDLVTLSQPVHIYADGPSGLFIGGSRSYSSGTLQVTVLLSGHLVNIP